ncbi:protein timeless homolog [Phtheirospermum japonicum]|uniref:Protein timeless homolog n=1 Tax=Phtheirospermum japonicum TaxID=374723 RepID=A0A830B1T9_9LAMI|nr:protein timeless homolog [Phtheirospermum japonicum]
MDGLSSICAGLGILDEDDNGKPIGYAKGEYCSDNLKDLLRFLRRDDPEKRDVFKQVCKWNIVGKDLIPIIEYCQEDRSLVLNSVKVLVFLTMPIDPISVDIPQQIEYLWGLKSAITFSDIVPVIVSLLENPLENLENEAFTEDDWKLVQLVLTLFRNILAIQDISTQLLAGGSATQFISLRDRFLELCFKENVMDLILVLSPHTGGSHAYLRQDNLLLLEIFYYVFKGQEPELIAKAHLKGSKVDAIAEDSVNSLQSIMKEEQEKRKLIRFHNLSCYSQLSGTFTRVSLSIREDIEKDLQEITSSDIVTFFKVAQFITSFQYHKCAASKIRMLDLVLKQSSEDSKEPQTVRVLLYKLFYDQTEEGMTQFLLNLIKSFDAHKQSKSDLANLLECMHVVLRLLENLQARGSLRVSKKARRKRTKKTTAKNENVSEPNADTVTPQTEVGNSHCGEPVDVNMLEKETLPNQDVDFEADKSIDDSIKVDQPVSKPHNMENKSEANDKNIADNNGLHLEDDESSGDEQLVLTDEVDFKVSSLVSALASNTIIQKLCWLLKYYKTNSITTNHYIITMLRRICDDLELSPMLYQLSLLTIFYDILEEQKLRPCKEHENIVTFLTTLVRRMLRKMKDYPLLFVEVLFWKTRKECHYINCGSMINELKRMRNGTGEGTSGNKSEGNGFVEGQKWVRRSIADALAYYSIFPHFTVAFLYRDGHPEEESDRSSERGNDIILTDEMSDKLKDLFEKYVLPKLCIRIILIVVNSLPESLIQMEKFQICKFSRSSNVSNLKLPAKTKKKSSEENSSTRKPTHSRKRVSAFNADQELKIKDLFEQFKDQRRCSYLIANELDGTGGISAAQRVAGESDDETLLSLRNRSKQKRNGSQYDERQSKKVAQELPEVMSDDELLSSVMAKTRKMSRDDEELMTDSFEKGLDDRNTQVTERDELAQSNQTGDVEVDTAISDHSSDSKMETVGVDDLKESDDKSFEKSDNSKHPLFDDVVDDELADFDENTDYVTTQQNSTARRRLRMVIDFEDDDE